MSPMLLSAGRRFLMLLGVVVGGTLVFALLGALLSGAPVSRAVSVAFYVVGALLLVAGFFIGNHGPVWINEGNQRGMLGNRKLHWASPEERVEKINNAAIFMFTGVVVLVLGMLADTRYPLL
jgi:hypothetical protein